MGPGVAAPRRQPPSRLRDSLHERRSRRRGSGRSRPPGDPRLHRRRHGSRTQRGERHSYGENHEEAGLGRAGTRVCDGWKEAADALTVYGRTGKSGWGIKQCRRVRVVESRYQGSRNEESQGLGRDRKRDCSPDAKTEEKRQSRQRQRQRDPTTCSRSARSRSSRLGTASHPPPPPRLGRWIMLVFGGR